MIADLGRLLRGRSAWPLIVLALASPALAEPSAGLLPLAFPVAEMRGPGTSTAAALATTDALRRDKALAGQPVVAVWGAQGAAALALAGGEVRAVPVGDALAGLVASEGARGAIPHARRQTAGPLAVVLSEPTEEYRHGVLGDAVEAKSLTITERQPVPPGPDPRPVPVKTTTVPAGAGAVFEDLAPRLADLDGDGTPEILVVKAYLDRGAALAIVAKREGAWTIVAETPPIGEPGRWLNPAAAADFERAGRPDIALVRMPHREGVLQVWRYEGGRLLLRHEAPGYANHVLGSTALDLAAAVDLDGDGVPELAIPTLDRRALAFLSLKGGIRELARVPLPAPARTGVAALGSGRDAHVLVGLEDGRVADVRP